MLIKSDHVNNSPELTQRLLGTKIDRDPQTTSSLRQKLRMNASGQSQSAGSLLPPPPLNRISASSSSLQSNFSNSLLQQQLQNDSLNNNNSINNNNNSTSSPNNASNTTEIQLPVSSGNHYHQHFLMQMSNASTSSPSSSSMPQKSSSNFYMDSPGHLGEQNNFHMSDMADGYGGIGEAGGGSVDLLAHLKDGPPSPNSSHLQQMSRQPQRRRVRRKANSSLDEQAEHLTEMSVRGLDLFRYASITEGIYQCTECAKENVQKTFKNKYSFQRHAFLYHEGKHRKVFPCPVCGKEFSRPDKMKNHMKTTHECFLPKEVNSYNPFSYLLTAATATEIQQMFPPMDGISASSTVTGSGSGNATSTSTTTTATATSEPPASTVTASALSTSLTLAAGLAATTASPSFPSPSHSKSAKIGETKIQIKSESLFVKQESLLKATLASGTSAQLQEAEEVK